MQEIFSTGSDQTPSKQQLDGQVASQTIRLSNELEKDTSQGHILQIIFESLGFA